MNRDEGRQRLREAQMLRGKRRETLGARQEKHDSEHKEDTSWLHWEAQITIKMIKYNKHIQVGEGKTWTTELKADFQDGLRWVHVRLVVACFECQMPFIRRHLQDRPVSSGPLFSENEISLVWTVSRLRKPQWFIEKWWKFKLVQYLYVNTAKHVGALHRWFVVQNKCWWLKRIFDWMMCWPAFLYIVCVCVCVCWLVWPLLGEESLRMLPWKQHDRFIGFFSIHCNAEETQSSGKPPSKKWGSVAI